MEADRALDEAPDGDHEEHKEAGEMKMRATDLPQRKKAAPKTITGKATTAVRASIMRTAATKRPTPAMRKRMPRLLGCLGASRRASR